MKTSILRDEVYGTLINFIWDASAAEMAEFIKKLDPDYDGDTDFHARCHVLPNTDPQTILILLPCWRAAWSPFTLSCLVHELFHATEHVMLYHDIEHPGELSEPWAYFLDSLVRRALEKLPLGAAFNSSRELMQ